MPYQVQHILEGKGMPTCVHKEDPVSKALSLMIEHDYSQLPVVRDEDGTVIPEGMITYEAILRGIRNFQAKIDDLKVRDVMVSAPVYSLEDDLFDILDRLKETNAVLVDIGHGPDLVGIVTSYDTTEYFRNRTEDLMRVEDIELMIKDFIQAAYQDKDGAVDQEKLNGLVATITDNASKNYPVGTKKKKFDDLTLGEYITLLIWKDTWPFFEPIFGVKRDFVNQLLNGVREIRNALAHFRGNITPDQRDQLKFGMEWLTRCQEEYQAQKRELQQREIIKSFYDGKPADTTVPQIIETEAISSQETFGTDFSITESATKGGRYAALADWLQSQPGRMDQIELSFNKIEEIIGADLPPSARSHRAWWANDSVSHSQSVHWLEAGWRTTFVNLNEGKITFNRIREREKAYIEFFSKLLDSLRKKANFTIREVSPDGASWIVIRTLPEGGPAHGTFAFSFTRERRLRVELYIDTGDKDKNKAIFDRLHEQKEHFEKQVGPIEWERLENRRASRIAVYHEGHINETKKHAELRSWAVDTMIKFVSTIEQPAEGAIREVNGA